VSDFLATFWGLALIRALTRIEKAMLRRVVLHLVEAILDEDCA
jgi:hypothetical protein